MNYGYLLINARSFDAAEEEWFLARDRVKTLGVDTALFVDARTRTGPKLPRGRQSRQSWVYR